MVSKRRQRALGDGHAWAAEQLCPGRRSFGGRPSEPLTHIDRRPSDGADPIAEPDVRADRGPHPDADIRHRATDRHPDTETGGHEDAASAEHPETDGARDSHADTDADRGTDADADRDTDAHAGTTDTDPRAHAGPDPLAPTAPGPERSRHATAPTTLSRGSSTLAAATLPLP